MAYSGFALSEVLPHTEQAGGGWEVRQNSGRNASDSLLNSVSA